MYAQRPKLKLRRKKLSLDCLSFECFPGFVTAICIHSRHKFDASHRFVKGDCIPSFKIRWRSRLLSSNDLFRCAQLTFTSRDHRPFFCSSSPAALSSMFWYHWISTRKTRKVYHSREEMRWRCRDTIIYRTLSCRSTFQTKRKLWSLIAFLFSNDRYNYLWVELWMNLGLASCFYYSVFPVSHRANQTVEKWEKADVLIKLLDTNVADWHIIVACTKRDQLKSIISNCYLKYICSTCSTDVFKLCRICHFYLVFI